MSRLIAVVAPSGAGKDTLLDGALAARPALTVVRRVITRPESAGGEGYEGVSECEFDRRLAAGAFRLWWPAHGLRYGVPMSVEDDLTAGRVVLFNGSRDALPAIHEAFPGVGVILITAPEPMLRARLMARGRESAEEIEERLVRAARPAPEGALVVANDGSIEEGVVRFLAAIDRLSAPVESV
ncbi:MAG: phosphonate metabolism protein/1,5-bisphosphokinase (PRPP-forming) PhnN [Pseudomonadota bacterium]